MTLLTAHGDLCLVSVMKTYGIRLLPMSLFPGLFMAVCRTAGSSVVPLLRPADILIKEQFAVDFSKVYSSKPAGKKTLNVERIREPLVIIFHMAYICDRLFSPARMTVGEMTSL